MSQFSANERPRTTKNIYFFKSGDHTFSGVKIPVNLRKHRNLDALLDDLNGRIPGLSHGVRQLRTPQGRRLVTNLEQLEHLGSYVCSERLNVQGSVPGVDFKKVKGLKDHQYQPSPYTPPSPPPAPSPDPEPQRSPKKKIKKKKKKKKEKTIENEEENESPDERSYNKSNDRRQSFDDDEYGEYDSDKRQSPKTVRRSPKKEKRSPKKGKSPDNKKSPKTNLTNKGQEDNHYQLIDYEDFDEAEEVESLQAPRPNKPSYSAPGTPSEERRFENLSPLDNKKLKHVQRRRISSKQSKNIDLVNVDEYTLPSSQSSMSMRSVSPSKNQEENENTLRSKPPKSRPTSASSKKSAEILTVSHGEEEPRNRRSAKSRQYGDDEEDEIYDNASRKLNEDEDDYKEFDEEVDEHRDERNLRSRQENDIHDEKDEEERSHQRDEDRSKSRQTARSARSARKPSDPATTTKQWGVELMSP